MMFVSDTVIVKKRTLVFRPDKTIQVLHLGYIANVILEAVVEFHFLSHFFSLTIPITSLFNGVRPF